MKKQIGIRLEKEMIRNIDYLCKYFKQKRTKFIEDGILLNMKEYEPRLPKLKIINTWGNDIEQMPLEPEYEEVTNNEGEKK